jgi:glycosyltransferase involved in cell wall biosynthesis
MPKIVSKCPNVKVWIIGSGPYERTLRESIEQESLSSYFKFYGYTNHCLTYQLLPICGVGLAPYVNEDKGTFRFCDPLKVKDYLACGLPIIITKVPACAYEIEEKRLGIAINYDSTELSDAAIKLLTDDKFYQVCKNNVINISTNLTWKHIYNQAFEKLKI